MDPTDAELSGYLEEALPTQRLAEIEAQLRTDDALRQRLVAVVGREDAGLISVGAIWRRNRLSCLDREQLSQFLLGISSEQQTDYLRFHIEVAGCRYCTANLDDLRQAQDSLARQDSTKVARTHRYFETSVGHLRNQ